MNRGSPHGHPRDATVCGASMRPRFMNRGSDPETYEELDVLGLQ